MLNPLLIPSALSKYSLLSITTEAHGDAMRTTKSTLSHIRAVKQLSDVLGCPPTWADVEEAIEIENAKPHHAWQKRCLEGIETILVDDGLDGKDELYDYAWHDNLTRSECKKIIRIEKVAEEIINELFKNSVLTPEDIFGGVREAFEMVINPGNNQVLSKDALADPDVVGFKSVICYRTGLAIPTHMSMDDVEDTFVDHITQLREDRVAHFTRVDDLPLNFYLVNKTAQLIAKSSGRYKKPFQFHTGLGDRDITLATSSPSHLQPFIRKFPNVPIVLLHASNPWTKEAGYLASVYDNVYADIGEVFPLLSKEGQENAVREILELCPTEKIVWSTDGHWFSETYLLAIMQVREALEIVLTVAQAIRAVQDILFTTSNNLYGLGLDLTPLHSLTSTANVSTTKLALRTLPPPSLDVHTLHTFLAANTSVKFLRVQWLDYTSTVRVRLIPVMRALAMLKTDPHLEIGIASAALGLLQNDTLISGLIPNGEYKLRAVMPTLKLGPCHGYASIQCEFLEKDNSPVVLCPRSILQHTLQSSNSLGLEFLVGFEIEIVFMSRSNTDGTLSTLRNSGSHAWSSSRALHGRDITFVLEEIYDTLAAAGINLELFHPESCTGQYEFVLPALPTMEAVDSLIYAREIIMHVVSNHGMRATIYPKTFTHAAGTASHMHISISSSSGNDKEVYETFYAGILKHLPAILAFTCSNPASYDRMQDGCWAGGTWVAWGTQNRETPLRKVEDSHFEIKVIDGLANMYFATAAIIAAGTNGVKEKETMVLGDCLKDPAQLIDEEREELGVKTRLPKTLLSALETLLRDETLVQLLGAEFVERYVATKKGELGLFAGMEKEDLKTWTMERY
ncbi:related to fluG protein [Rhynchosporium secalis]|uniref:Related to fluG protein n=1 Tax=Rhynchosporium secalis TaxID=38038 RepID=A0A1E1M603_RHYSE|nr:related to fluG protein [Rhynchosporium secalis]